MSDENTRLESAIHRLGNHGLTRRQALRLIVASGAGVAASPLLSKVAWADESSSVVPLPRPDDPVTLPLYRDTIPDGLEPEGGTFRIFNYANYVSKDTMDKFAAKYDVNVEVTTFQSNSQAIAKMASNDVDVDVTELLSSKVPRAAVGKLLLPINHSYIPNLKKNVWPVLQSPFYDEGSRYTVPYVTYTTGIGWRNDKVNEDIAHMDNPWSIFWKAHEYKGYVGVMAGARLAIGLGLLYNGITNLNTTNPKHIDQALKSLKALVPICDPKVNISEYRTLPAGTSWLHESWSGDLVQAVLFYLPEGTPPDVLSYWHAPKGKGPVQNDTWCVVAGSKKPVLAHLWLNFMLDREVAYDNFVNFLGYQPPIKGITGDRLISEGIIPESLRAAAVEPHDFGPESAQFCALSVQGLRMWQSAYSEFIAGV